jgi:hypothetical protein
LRTAAARALLSLAACRYRNQIHDVLTVDTGSLVRAHAGRIRLSPINSGATLYPNAPARGTQTFLPIEDYPWREHHRRKTISRAVTELAVIDGVPDIVDHIVRVERRRRTEVLAVLLDRS